MDGWHPTLLLPATAPLSSTFFFFLSLILACFLSKSSFLGRLSAVVR